MNVETITILHALAGSACKRFIAGESPRPYNVGRDFTAETLEVNDLKRFSEVLAAVENDPTAFLIRGGPKPGISASQPTRRSYLGEDAAFVACSRRLFCVDIDNVIGPDGVDPCSIAAVDHVISLLPPEFHDSDVAVQFSNSAGTLDAGRKIKVHLWYWGDREYSDLELRRWAKATGVADPALYNPVQPHFLARPQFVNLADPFEGKSRTVFVKKAKAEVSIDLPALASFAAAPRQLTEQENAELSRNQEGKVIDGREQLLRGIRWSVLFRNHVTSLDAFFEHVWAAFSEQAELGTTTASSNSYSLEIVRGLCERDWTNHGMLVPAVLRPTLSGSEAVALLRATLRDALQSKAVLAIKGTAGLGKSKMAADEIVALPDIERLHVDIFVPSRKEQRQWEAELAKKVETAGKDAAILLIEGRNEQNCVQHEAANALSKAGLPASKLLCRTKDAECKAFQDCPYRAQFASQQPAIRIYTHSHLATPRPQRLPPADIAVVDESFHNVTVSIDENIPIDGIHGLRGVNTNRLFANTVGADTGRASKFGELLTTCRAVAEAISSGRPVLDELRGRGITDEALSSAANVYLENLKYPRVAPNDPPRRVTSEINRCERKKATMIAGALQALGVELGTGRSESHAIRTNANGTFNLCRRKNLPRLCDVGTIVVLDADCDENNLLPILPQARIVPIEARFNAKLTQCTDLSFSRRYLGTQEGKKINAKAVAALLDRIRRLPGRRKLIATYRALIPHLQPSLPGVAFCYFGNLRGTNDYENCDTVIVIGRQFIPTEAVENIARALHWDSREPLVLGQSVPRRYQAGDGVLRSYDELDPRLRSVRAASREAETRQALARARLVHATDRKEVFLFSSQPIGIAVDALIQFEPSKGERIFEKLDGALPFGAADLVRLSSGEFKDERAALRWRNRPETTPVAIRDSFRRAGVVLAETHYRRAGQRGPQSRLLVDPLRHPMPHITLAPLLAETGQAPVEIAPLPWVSEPMAGFPGFEMCRLRKLAGAGSK